MGLDEETPNVGLELEITAFKEGSKAGTDDGNPAAEDDPGEETDEGNPAAEEAPESGTDRGTPVIEEYPPVIGTEVNPATEDVPEPGTLTEMLGTMVIV